MKECVECGEEIPRARVEARPEAECCITCQEGRERRGEFKKPLLDVQPVMKAGELDSMESTFIQGSRT